MRSALQRPQWYLMVYSMLWVAGIAWFVVGDQLRSLSDDSVSYLIMGQYWSPWHPVPVAITDIYPYELYPPLFAWLLAITDAAWHMPWAHVLMVILLGIAWYVCFYLAKQWLNNAWAALGVIILLSLASYSLIHVQRILSENLYLLLSFIVLLQASAVIQFKPRHSLGGGIEKQGLVFALLLSLLVLTRSTGLVMVLAWFIQQFFHGLSQADRAKYSYWLRMMVIGFVPIIAWVLWIGLRPDIASDRYSGDLLKGVLSFDVDHPLQSVYALFWPQIVAIRDAWYSVWMVYWIEDFNFSYVIVSMIGMLGGAGLIWRLRHNQMDAWYVLGTLLLLVMWPYPGQMIRFFYVIAPFWLLYALYVTQSLVSLLVSQRFRTLSTNTMVLLMLIAVIPVLGHMVGRANFPKAEWAYSDIAEFYLRVDPVEARNDAIRQLQTFADMKRIRQSTTETDRVIWNTAGYIPLLTGRYGQYFPATNDRTDFLQRIADNSATHIYLSRFNPRRTTLDNNELNIYPLLQSWTHPLWIRNSANGQVDAMFLKIDKSRLRDELAGLSALPLRLEAGPGPHL